MIMSLWSTGLPHVASMAQDGNGVISRQPRSGLTRSLRQSSGQQQIRTLDLPALQSAPLERQARRNEYVDAPGIETLYNKRNNNESPTVVLSGGHHHRAHRSTCIVISDRGKTKVLKLAKREVIRTSEEGSDASAQGGTPVYDSKKPLYCPFCGRCYCDKCRARTELPHAWLCGDRYECSAENTLEYCTCLCCVKGLFYHLADSNHDDYSWSDKPCSCGDKKCRLRWSLMGMIPLVLPCLRCYLPGRGCISARKLCFARDGCKCEDQDYSFV
ncbi:protein sprouty homolog 2-like isoform X2 [Acanthaster planci]|uniref:Protein sprouty homolog 2-like isoform X2 n=1 Tax=Acanthaster planci TaxID=133434 RepID=A0A8B7XZ11_ACAPL|nr:protein sprouty homolog 2-like isoform X2 [Acanthaster planci]